MDNPMSGREIPQAVRLALKELREYLAEIYGERLRAFTFTVPMPGGIFTRAQT
jgi:hypothetical protein